MICVMDEDLIVVAISGVITSALLVVSYLIGA